tara:strand:- start:1719 stop:1925 length:207 start_codon:yes stop_codon:yes gene_type:complete
MSNEEIPLEVNFKYVEDYGGVQAWLIEEYYEGKKTHEGHRVLQKEYFDDLQQVIELHLERGAKITITK